MVREHFDEPQEDRDMTGTRPTMRSIVLGARILTLCHCSDEVTYTAAEDAKALSIVEKTWTLQTDDGDIVITLCEDPAPSDVEAGIEAGEDGCQIGHVVRGDGSTTSRTEEEAGGVGCGGCPFSTVAFVKGTATGGGFGVLAQPINGTIFMQTRYDEDPYALPYTLDLQVGDQTLTGVISKQGIMRTDNLPDGGDGLVGRFDPTESTICR
jgi:hypothetical protein